MIEAWGAWTACYSPQGSVQQCSNQHGSASMAEQTHMAGQKCPIIQKEGFLDVQSNKQVLITGICCLQQFFGFWEVADRGLGLLLPWPLSLAFGEGFG